jgi:hypothetical protein
LRGGRPPLFPLLVPRAAVSMEARIPNRASSPAAGMGVPPEAEPAGPEKETPPANRRSYEPIRNETGRPPGHGKKERVMGTRATGIARRVSLQGEATFRYSGFVCKHSASSPSRWPSECHGFANRTGAHCTLGDFPKAPGRIGGSAPGPHGVPQSPPANPRQSGSPLTAPPGCIVRRINEMYRRRVTPVLSRRPHGGPDRVVGQLAARGSRDGPVVKGVPRGPRVSFAEPAGFACGSQHPPANRPCGNRLDRTYKAKQPTCYPQTPGPRTEWS